MNVYREDFSAVLVFAENFDYSLEKIAVCQSKKRK